MKCPHCCFEWESRRTVMQRSLLSLGPIILAVMLCVSFFTGVGLWVAYGETAVEIIPGVTHYGGHSTSVEIVPGVKQFSGAYNGTVTEIVPGVTSYQIQPRDQYRPRYDTPTSLPYPVTPHTRTPNLYEVPDWRDRRTR